MEEETITEDFSEAGLTEEQLAEAMEVLDKLSGEEDMTEDTQTPAETEAATTEELTDEQILEMYKGGDFLTKDQTSEVVQKRLAREKSAREAAAEKARQEAEAKALEDQKEYAKLAEQRATKITDVEGERDSYKIKYETSLKNQAVRDALLAEGAKAERVAVLVRQVDLASVELDAEGNPTGADAAAKSVKTELPELFGSPDPAEEQQQTHAGRARTATQFVKGSPAPAGEKLTEEQQKAQEVSDKNYAAKW